MDFSPAMSATSDMTDEELDQYFATYVPLSNLPTPPPARDHSQQQDVPSTPTPASTTTTQSSPSAQLEVYATHLANLVPSNVSSRRPHGSVIYGFLERADLPDEVVAFAACVLDALSWKFAASWRDVLAPSEFQREVKTFLRTDASRSAAAHVSPNVIVLAALSLAHGFLVDRLRSCRHWSVKESKGAFTTQEIEATKRAILLDMNYGLFRIQDDMVQRMLRDMRRPKTSSASSTAALARQGSVSKDERRRTFSLDFSGTAVWTHGVHTPEPSP